MRGSHYDELIDRAAEARVPLTVLAELTYRCVFHCRHCHLHPRADAGAELAAPAWTRILDELAAAGTLFLTFSGGEPFCRPDLFELVDAAVARGFSLTLFTSGYPLTPAGVDRLADSGVRLVEVSFYSSQPEVFEAVTGLPGSFRRVADNLERLRAAGLPVFLKAPVMRSNYRTLPATYRWAAANGYQFLADFTLFPDDSPAGCNHGEILSEAELEEAMRLAAPHQPPARPGNTRPSDTLCSAGHRFCTIDPAGRVFACSSLPQPAGDLTRSPFQKIWADSPALNEIRELTRLCWQPCRTCGLEPGCRRCPALSYLTAGTVEGISEYICRETRLRAKVAGEIQTAKAQRRDEKRKESAAK